MRRLRRRWLIGAVIVAVVAGAGAFVWVKHGDAKVQYRTAVASLGTVTQTLSLSGNLTPLGKTDLNFAGSGKVATLDVQVGQRVTAGQVLATLDATALQSNLTVAEATVSAAQARMSLDQAGPTAQSLASARAQVNSANATLQNDMTAYNDTVAVNQQQYSADGCNAAPQPAACSSDITKERQSDDQAAGQVSMARVQLQNAQEALRALQQGSTSQQIQMDRSQVEIDQVGVSSAQSALDNASITSPVNGVVASVNIAAGDQAGSANGSANSSGASSTTSSSSTSTPAIVVITPGAFEVAGSISDALVNEITTGQKAQVIVAGSNEALTASVTAVAQQATITSGVATFPVTVTLDGTNPALRDGMSASVNVIVNQVVQVLTVPTSAVHAGSSGTTIQVLVNGAAQSRSVEVGASDSLRTQILSGLSAGDQVIVATVSASVPTSTSGGGLFGGFGGGAGRGGGAAGGGGGGGARN